MTVSFQKLTKWQDASTVAGNVFSKPTKILDKWLFSTDSKRKHCKTVDLFDDKWSLKISQASTVANGTIVFIVDVSLPD